MLYHYIEQRRKERSGNTLHATYLVSGKCLENGNMVTLLYVFELRVIRITQFLGQTLLIVNNEKEYMVINICAFVNAA